MKTFKKLLIGAAGASLLIAPAARATARGSVSRTVTPPA